MTRSDPERADPIRRSLARLYFAEGDYLHVIRLLGCLCPKDRFGDVKPREDFQDRLLLSLAQLSRGGTAACQAQLPLLRVLAAMEGADASDSVLAILSQAVNAKTGKRILSRP